MFPRFFFSIIYNRSIVDGCLLRNSFLKHFKRSRNETIEVQPQRHLVKHSKTNSVANTASKSCHRENQRTLQRTSTQKNRSNLYVYFKNKNSLRYNISFVIVCVLVVQFAFSFTQNSLILNLKIRIGFPRFFLPLGRRFTKSNFLFPACATCLNEREHSERDIEES